MSDTATTYLLLPTDPAALQDVLDAAALAHSLAGHLRDCWPSPGRPHPPAGPPTLATYSTLIRHVLHLATIVHRFRPPAGSAGDEAHLRWLRTRAPLWQGPIEAAMDRIDWVVGQLAALEALALAVPLSNVDGTNKAVMHPTVTLPWRPLGGLPLPQIDPAIISALEWAAGQLLPLPDGGRPGPPGSSGQEHSSEVAPQGDVGATEARRPQTEGRLAFDPATFTVTLDGEDHHIKEPKTFHVYKAIADAEHPPITNAVIQGRVQGVKGRKAISTRLKSLPPALRKTIKTSTAGHWLELPPRRETKKKGK
jgi:hypothetical protein